MEVACSGVDEFVNVEGYLPQVPGPGVLTLTNEGHLYERAWAKLGQGRPTNVQLSTISATVETELSVKLHHYVP